MNKSNQDILDQLAQTIFDKKGSNILALDVRNISSMTDYLLIAEGGVERHVLALCQHVVDKLKELGCPPINLEGDRTGDWVVIDCIDIMVHLFIPELRQKYALEELWRTAKIVKLSIVVKKVEE